MYLQQNTLKSDETIKYTVELLKSKLTFRQAYLRDHGFYFIRKRRLSKSSTEKINQFLCNDEIFAEDSPIVPCELPESTNSSNESDCSNESSKSTLSATKPPTLVLTESATPIKSTMSTPLIPRQTSPSIVNSKIRSVKSDTPQSNCIKSDLKPIPKLITVKPQSKLSSAKTLVISPRPTTPPSASATTTTTANSPSNDWRQLKNDYSQYFVNTGQRPQNFIRDSGIVDRFEEYPKLKELIRLKQELIQETNCPAFYMRMNDITPEKLSMEFECMQFDVVLLSSYWVCLIIFAYLFIIRYTIVPPLPDSKNVKQGERIWTWPELCDLPIDEIAGPRAFVFLWVNSGNGLDEGRDCLRKWGFRRCEDICWIKTNKSHCYKRKADLGEGFLDRTKEHCLMGIRGTVRRSCDADFIHANIDIDLIITDEDDNEEMPNEIFDIIENFCLGRRRLFLFGSTVRQGWLTVGEHFNGSRFDREEYLSFFRKTNTTGTTDRIEQIRPKSPSQQNGLVKSNSTTESNQNGSNQNLLSVNTSSLESE